MKQIRVRGFTGKAINKAIKKLGSEGGEVILSPGEYIFKLPIRHKGRSLKGEMKEKETDKLIMEGIEKETRVEMKPVPPDQLDRIERMLKYICQKINPLVLEEDDISDILEEK